MSAFVIHLIRHGEVDNPDRVIYAALPGFGLSARGRTQAGATAARLEGRPIMGLVASPLQRAVETADIVAARLDLEPSRDARLREWDLADRWAGTPWAELEQRFPGELRSYLDHPDDLPFSTESLEEAARRVAGAITDLAARHPGAEAAIVSHQDPIQAARLALTGRPLSALQEHKPGHGSILTLTRRGDGWAEIGYWEPDQGPPFPPVTALEE